MSKLLTSNRQPGGIWESAPEPAAVFWHGEFKRERRRTNFYRLGFWLLLMLVAGFALTLHVANGELNFAAVQLKRANDQLRADRVQFEKANDCYRENIQRQLLDGARIGAELAR
jgi:hypothetical protein